MARPRAARSNRRSSQIDVVVLSTTASGVPFGEPRFLFIAAIVRFSTLDVVAEFARGAKNARMHTGLLHLHSLLRWVVVFAGVVAIVRAQQGVAGNAAYRRLPGTVFVMSLHLQLTIGLVLYFGTSPLVTTFLASPGASMKDALLRFFGVEHLIMMLAAVIVATIGSAKARRGADDVAKNKAARLFFTIAMVLLLAGIPWPFRAVGAGRAWFPGMTPTAAATTTTTPQAESPAQPAQPVAAPSPAN